MLVFPESIRLEKPDEIPNSPEKPELLQKIRNARIQQGYVAGKVNENLFSCYAEANVDAPQVWKVFRSLCEDLLPNESMFIITELD